MAEEEKRKRSVLGSDITSSNTAIQAYLDAKVASSNERSNWDIIGDTVTTGILGAAGSYLEEKQIAEENRKLELEGYENEFSTNVNKITENAGSLGEEYYSVATEQAKLMQEEYMKAVQEGDKETQSKLKMKLQGLSASVASLKDNLNLAAELHDGELLSNGRTAIEKEIAAVCTNPANIVYEEGEWKWKNPNFDGGEGSKEFYTMDDLNDSLDQIDSDVSMRYLDYENGMNAAGSNYVNGVQGAAEFDYERIKTAIGDQFITEDNIMSVMHDDFRQSGESHTFAADLGGYLDSMGDSLYEGLRIDANGDGVFTPDDWDSAEDKKIIIDAITNKNNKHYNYASSKDIVAGYLTMHSENKFYGGHKTLSLKERKALEPNPNETPKSFIKRGGIMGAVEEKGIIWSEENQMWQESISESAQDILDKA